MGVYSTSRAAESDLADIYEFGILKFGTEQARKYLLKLQTTLQILAKTPDIGRSASEFHLGLRRFSCESHIIFYQATDEGIFVIRILNQSMDFERYL